MWRSRAWPPPADHQRPRGTANMPTTYRVFLETETLPREAAVALTTCPLPGRRPERPRRRPSRTVPSHRQPADPTSPRDLVRAPRDHAAAPRPERASPRPRQRGRDTPPQRRVLAHHNRRALTARLRPEQAPRRQANRTNPPEQLLDTRFPGEQFPWGASSRSSTATGAPSSAPSPSCGAPRSHRRRWRDRPMAGALRRAPAYQGRPHGPSARSVSCCERLGATSGDTLPHNIAHTVVGPGHRHEAV